MQRDKMWGDIWIHSCAYFFTKVKIKNIKVCADVCSLRQSSKRKIVVLESSAGEKLPTLFSMQFFMLLNFALYKERVHNVNQFYFTHCYSCICYLLMLLPSNYFNPGSQMSPAGQNINTIWLLVFLIRYRY